MLIKLWLAYNLTVIGLIVFLGVKSVNSASGLVFPLLLLPLAYYLATKLLPSRSNKTAFKPLELKIETKPKSKTQKAALEGKVMPGPSGISDRDRRLFLKLIGSTGLSLFLMSLVSKKAEAAFFGSMPGPGTIAIKDSSGTPIDPAEKQPTDGYKIAQVDDSSDPDYAYYGFIDKDGNWYVQRETLTGANAGDYRYFKGGSNFATNWTGRDSLGYAEFDSIF